MNENTQKNQDHVNKQSANVRPVLPVYEYAELQSAMMNWGRPAPEEIFSPSNGA